MGSGSAGRVSAWLVPVAVARTSTARGRGAILDGMAEATVRELPVGRLISIDERGIALRVTWRLEHGFVNVSVWRDDRCSETFHLTPEEAARLVSFLVEGLAGVASAASGPAASLRLLPEPRRRQPAEWAKRLQDASRAGRHHAADFLQHAVNRLRS